MAKQVRTIATALFALTTFLSAFLLFEVQPLLSKRLLPWFGGGPAVWTTCVLFFQSVLFAGYAYAHASEHWLPRTAQTVIHILLLVVAWALLPILPGDADKPAAGDDPVAAILMTLAVSVGAAYFLVSSTGPLVSAWFSRVVPGRSPYRLYALSNFGSLLALVSYPFVVEPALAIDQQASYWGWAFRLFACLSAASAVVALFAAHGENVATDSLRASDDRFPHARPTRRQRIAWIALPAFASVAFLATTNVVCQDVASVPFLWVAPLSLYLITFIICFDHERWYHRRFFAWMFLALVALGPLVYPAMFTFDLSYQFVYELVLYLMAMFAVCMICHGELVRLRPAPEHLTAFYLSIAGGGMLGGVLVSLVAPVLFSTYYEWPIAAIGACILAGSVLAGDEVRQWLREQRRLWLPITLVALVVGFSVAKDLVIGEQDLVWQGRNFYGVVTVTDTRDENPELRVRLLRNGRITHGLQFLASDKRRLPTSYYAPESGVGQLLAYFRGGPPIRVGDVGLGAGTLAAYARPGDEYRFYEINPHVIDLARDTFTYVSDSAGNVHIVEGDARLSLEREEPNAFDVLVLDAFSGDAIPTHLLTTEAFDVYRQHLKSDGALCIHVTNQFVDLTGIVRRLADKHGYGVVHVDQPEEGRETQGTYTSDWMVLSSNKSLLASINKHVVQPADDWRTAPLWTDKHTDLFRILK